MSYTALYRKMRPDTFSKLAGQQTIVRTLSNQIKGNRISHAYLFCGTRGTGKTSAAKIFAKAVNCENPNDGEPCGVCGFCSLPKEDSSLVIYEIDAASNNGVDNIRDIIETVKYPPTVGSYKVYIIDEVHMLSTGAFNALLKTLEEPPSHVIFILATTEPQKIPATIHSRCQRFDFKRISGKEMFETLKGYMQTEGVTIQDEALHFITGASDGAMRDALSILDQCMAFYYQEEITLEKVQEILGAVSYEYLYKFANLISEKNSLSCINLIEEIIVNGKDISQFVAETVEHFRNLLVALNISNESVALNYSAERTKKMREQSEKIGATALLYYVFEFSELQSKMKYANNQRILLEVTCLKLCSLNSFEKSADQSNSQTSSNSQSSLDALSNLTNKLNQLENMIKTQQNINSSTPPQTAVQEISTIKLDKSIPADVENAIKQWKNFKNSLTTTEDEKILGGFLNVAQIRYLDGVNKIVLTFENDTSMLFAKKYEDLLLEKINAFFKKEFVLELVENVNYEKKHIDKYGVKDVFDYSALNSFQNGISGITVNQLA